MALRDSDQGVRVAIREPDRDESGRQYVTLTRVSQEGST